jgi:hypothetical protein
MKDRSPAALNSVILRGADERAFSMTVDGIKTLLEEVSILAPPPRSSLTASSFSMKTPIRSSSRKLSSMIFFANESVRSRVDGRSGGSIASSFGEYRSQNIGVRM